MSEELRSRLASIITGFPGRPKHKIPTAATNMWDDAIAKADSILALIDHLEADGRVLVPRMPTQAMQEAGARMTDDEPNAVAEARAAGVWFAMLSAAPSVATGENDG